MVLLSKNCSVAVKFRKMTSKQTLEHLFEYESTVKHVTLKMYVFPQALESMGILRDDPRIRPIIDTLEAMKKRFPGKIYSINNIKLDYNEFRR